MLEVRRLMGPGLELVYEEKEEQFYTLDLTVPRSVMAATLAANDKRLRLPTQA
jgi:hypothetical protein